MCGESYVLNRPAGGVHTISNSAGSANTSFTKSQTRLQQQAVDKVYSWYVNSRQRAGTDFPGDTTSWPISKRGSKNPLGVLLGRKASQSADLLNDDAVDMLATDPGYAEDFLWDLLSRHDRAMEAESFREGIQIGLLDLARDWSLLPPNRN